MPPSVSMSSTPSQLFFIPFGIPSPFQGLPRPFPSSTPCFFCTSVPTNSSFPSSLLTLFLPSAFLPPRILPVLHTFFSLNSLPLLFLSSPFTYFSVLFFLTISSLWNAPFPISLSPSVYPKPSWVLNYISPHHFFPSYSPTSLLYFPTRPPLYESTFYPPNTYLVVLFVIPYF